jgi:hypothetical protein
MERKALEEVANSAQHTEVAVSPPRAYVWALTIATLGGWRVLPANRCQSTTRLIVAGTL